MKVYVYFCMHAIQTMRHAKKLKTNRERKSLNSIYYRRWSCASEPSKCSYHDNENTCSYTCNTATPSVLQVGTSCCELEQHRSVALETFMLVRSYVRVYMVYTCDVLQCCVRVTAGYRICAYAYVIYTSWRDRL